MLKNLIPLNLPEPPLRLGKKEGKLMVWDELRKKYLYLSPEEWVRQHFVYYLKSRDYKNSCIALEGGFRINDRLKRTDIMIYKDGKAALLIECKAPQVKLDMRVLEQASLYNLHFQVPFLVITNGLEHFCFLLDNEIRQYRLQKNIPSYAEL